MIRSTTINLADDLDGSTVDVNTFRFSYQGTDYEIDLSSDNADSLEFALGPYINAGRKVVRKRGKAKGRMDREQAAQVRAWAAVNGYELAPKGRIPANVTEAYRAAQR